MSDGAWGDTASGRADGVGPRRERARNLGSSVLTPPTGLPVFPDLEKADAERADIIRCCRRQPETVLDPCVCGHAKASHEHYRPGWDCGFCGAATCMDFRPEGGGRLRRVLRRLGLTT
jgi:hypothetical protein